MSDGDDGRHLYSGKPLVSLRVFQSLKGEYLGEWKQREMRRQRLMFRLAHDYADNAEFGTAEGVGNTFGMTMNNSWLEDRV